MLIERSETSSQCSFGCSPILNGRTLLLMINFILFNKRDAGMI